MKHILLVGAGRSATVLIDYLKDLSSKNRWRVTVADHDLRIAQQKTGDHPFVQAAQADIQNDEARRDLVTQADVVISMLPPSLHYLVALDCLKYKKHLLTASYVDDQVKALESSISKNGLLFLCEMGLDPGIDHMSAMQLIERVKALGGHVTSFKSHCGGLVAPLSDDNPWHYKISWNSRNVILAGKAGATYKENGEIKHLKYEELFTKNHTVALANHEPLSYYPNRDSLSYIPVYGLNDVKTFIRTTLRHPDFCLGWKNIINLKLTDETPQYNTNGMTIAEFFTQHFEKYVFAGWLDDMLDPRLTQAEEMMESLTQLLDDVNEKNDQEDEVLMVNEQGRLDSMQAAEIEDAAAEVAINLNDAKLSLSQLIHLGLGSDEMINKGLCSAADVLQFLAEKNLKLQPGERDMIVMAHELEYEMEGFTHSVQSTLTVCGEDDVRTAMAKTVGLPLGIAAKLILEGKITEKGLHIPVTPAIYIPVMKELEKHGVKFEESIA